MAETARDPRYDILFEPVRIGPVVAKNRFFQVPHCNGMGYRDASAHAEMRAVKAQGGWAVVCTEQAEIHYSSEVTPYIEARIWDEQDIPALALVADRVHEHGALAGIELAYNGLNGPNLYSRTAPVAPTALPVASWFVDPVQAREMTKRDIANLRRWHRQAVDRSLRAGYDLVYVYLRLHPPLPVAPLQPAHRRVRGQPREPDAAAARAAHRHRRGGRRPRWRGLPDHR